MGHEFKIYTKGGDKGQTSLLGGTRVSKYDIRIEAYGTLDELNSFIGIVRDMNIGKDHKEALLKIQYKIFEAESHLAADKPEQTEKLPRITEDDIVFLEKEIDRMNESLPELRSFILPGGHVVVSYCHVCRTICRRAERLTIKLSELYQVDERILKYLNRLSDYFFVLARMIGKELGTTEVLWKPNK
ncbi:MAG TPA: cob(I)yrinic acid a,c-diamide adenosyltransferase [Bacteroidales bacterium]|nr:cob(I)yrinic acid a,c-diamide adenosyltransferase [Bacteroidales bacterium]HPE54921.1 cob(I)yrinic acid a,c-diamide adenosyltransferase [Bacteroidales bacterium]HRX97078.1 cob(I)yrinic acid a,c-diamide adenosyltransferase [Bacteroidales bacterium]